MGLRDVCGFELIFQLSDSIDSSTVGGVWSQDVCAMSALPWVQLARHSAIATLPTAGNLRSSPDAPSQPPPAHGIRLGTPLACATGSEGPVKGQSLSCPSASLWGHWKTAGPLHPVSVLWGSVRTTWDLSASFFLTSCKILDFFQSQPLHP